MNKKIVLLAAAAAIAAVPAMASIKTFANGGAKFALPEDPWTMTNTARNLGYGAVPNVNRNGGSAMCVECHSVNPSSHITAPTALGGVTSANLMTQSGSHFVMNKIAQAGTLPANPWGTTDTGGGFGGGFGTQPRTATGSYEKDTAWTGTVNGFSKYQGAYTYLGSTLAKGDMICESCHNIVNNLGNSLLLEAYTDNGNSDLCKGCHSNMHGDGNLPAFNSANRKRHHVMRDPSTVYTTYNDTFVVAQYGGADSSVMWAPTFSSVVAGAWCTAPFTTVAVGNQVSLATLGVEFRNQCNVSGQGAKAVAAVTGDILPVNQTTITCANCHRPHNAISNAGAFILRTGDPAMLTWNNAGPATTNPNASANATAYGIRRQKDTLNNNYSAAKVYGEYVPLCKGCHQGYGN